MAKEGGGFKLILAHLSGLYRSLGPIGWPLALIGLWREWREKSFERAKIYLALLPSSFSFLAWPSTDARLVFVFAPLGILFLIRGLIYLKEVLAGKRGKLVVIVIILGAIILNYYFHLVGDYFPFIEIEDVVKGLINL